MYWIVFNQIVHQLIILLIIHTVTSIDFRLLHKMLTKHATWRGVLTQAKVASFYFCLDDVVHASCEWCIVISYNCITTKLVYFGRGATNSCMFNVVVRCTNWQQQTLLSYNSTVFGRTTANGKESCIFDWTLFLFDFTSFFFAVFFCQITDNVRRKPNK